MRHRLGEGPAAGVDSQGRRSPVLATARAQRGAGRPGNRIPVFLLWKEVTGDGTPRKRTWPSFALAEDGGGG